MVGRNFGKLVVISKAPAYISPKGRVRRRWLCACDCGITTIVKEDHLKGGHTTSCGCKSKEALEKGNAARKKDVYVRRPRLVFFKKVVKKRDRGLCFICKSKTGIEIHHLYNFTSHNKLAGIVENGICLCKECHLAFHMSLGGFVVSCTPQDFIDWAALRVSREKIRRKWKRHHLLT